ncbi:Putative uncharacterized transposon-derived protein [Frankliniella fusca]|uniref:Uncharacterized transposon-derived protein n=1 Tax=Frankliniella fusca TaxID=407009 RepID=A0AAE1L6J8_9NEOP|nr:Putative uncharacterized transposon-derived protein [Frankliniella fusca]
MDAVLQQPGNAEDKIKRYDQLLQKCMHFINEQRIPFRLTFPSAPDEPQTKALKEEPIDIIVSQLECSVPPKLKNASKVIHDVLEKTPHFSWDSNGQVTGQLEAGKPSETASPLPAAARSPPTEPRSVGGNADRPDQAVGVPSSPTALRSVRSVARGVFAELCWQCDLSDMQSLAQDNDGYRYILCVICVFSKFAWRIPVKNKTSSEIIRGFASLFSTTQRRCTRLVADKGGEFNNRRFHNFLEQNDMEFFSTSNPDTKASVCERFQRTLKEKLYRVFTHRENYRYTDGLLDDIVHAYNNTYHRSIKMTPHEASQPENTLKVYHALYPPERKKKCPKLREHLKRVTLGTWNWSEEIFKIVSVIPHSLPCYKIKHLDGDEVSGTFYEPELQKVRKPDSFKIAYIVRSIGKNSSRKHLVHWRGYPEKSRSWVFDRDILSCS